MNLNALRTANFSKFDTAVTKWDEMVGKLGTLADDMRTNVKGKADKANWKGVNSDVTREFIRQTATEFDEMETQAKSVRNILRDTASELRGYQKAINDRIESEKDLHVTDTGEGTFQVDVRDGAPEGTDGEDLKNFIQDQLSKATTSDKSAADVLNSMMELNDKGFTNISYTDRDSAAQALADAERAAELAQQDPGDLSPEEFDELVELTGDNHDDPLFAERFTTTLGPEGTLKFWTGIHEPRLSGELLNERLDEFGELQKNLGLTLATATQSDSEAMTQWEYKMADLGDEKVEIDGRPSNTYGFQAMSALMHEGDFDDQFLDNYGNQLVATEKKLSHNGTLDNPWFDPTLGVGNLSHIEGDNGRDPFIGFMKALSHSPQASLEFFDDPFVSKDEDHGFEDGDGNKRSLSVFDYLFEERKWPEQLNSDFDVVDTGHNAMAEALEAATTGHVAGEEPTKDLPPHSEEQADLFAEIVKSVAEDDKRLTDHSSMSDNMGAMAAEYLPDISRAMANDQLGNTDKLFPLAGSQANFENEHATRFLFAVGQDPEGYAAVEVGQRAYTASLMDYHLNPDVPADQKYPGDPQEIIENISRRSGEIGGTLAAGRQEADMGPAVEKDKAYAHAMTQAKNGISGAISTGIGVGTSFIATPVGGAVASGVAGTVSSLILEEIFAAHEPNAAEEAAKVAAGKYEDSYDASVYLNQRSAELAAQAHDLPYADKVADWALRGTEVGFNTASGRIDEFAPDLETDI